MHAICSGVGLELLRQHASILYTSELLEFVCSFASQPNSCWQENSSTLICVPSFIIFMRLVGWCSQMMMQGSASCLASFNLSKLQKLEPSFSGVFCWRVSPVSPNSQSAFVLMLFLEPRSPAEAGSLPPVQWALLHRRAAL